MVDSSYNNGIEFEMKCPICFNISRKMGHYDINPITIEVSSLCDTCAGRLRALLNVNGELVNEPIHQRVEGLERNSIMLRTDIQK